MQTNFLLYFSFINPTSFCFFPRAFLQRFKWHNKSFSMDNDAMTAKNISILNLIMTKVPKTGSTININRYIPKAFLKSQYSDNKRNHSLIDRLLNDLPSTLIRTKQRQSKAVNSTRRSWSKSILTLLLMRAMTRTMPMGKSDYLLVCLASIHYLRSSILTCDHC